VILKVGKSRKLLKGTFRNLLGILESKTNVEVIFKFKVKNNYEIIFDELDNGQNLPINNIY